MIRNKALVVGGNDFGRVGLDHKRRRTNGDLLRKIELDIAATDRRRRMLLDDPTKYAVELTRRYARACRRIEFLRYIEDLVRSRPLQCTYRKKEECD